MPPPREYAFQFLRGFYIHSIKYRYGVLTIAFNSFGDSTNPEDIAKVIRIRTAFNSFGDSTYNNYGGLRAQGRPFNSFGDSTEPGGSASAGA